MWGTWLWGTWPVYWSFRAQLVYYFNYKLNKCWNAVVYVMPKNSNDTEEVGEDITLELVSLVMVIVEWYV